MKYLGILNIFYFYHDILKTGLEINTKWNKNMFQIKFHMQLSAECCVLSARFWNKKCSNMYGNESNKERMKNVFLFQTARGSIKLTKMHTFRILKSQLKRFVRRTTR